QEIIYVDSNRKLDPKSFSLQKGEPRNLESLKISSVTQNFESRTIKLVNGSSLFVPSDLKENDFPTFTDNHGDMFELVRMDTSKRNLTAHGISIDGPLQSKPDT